MRLDHLLSKESIPLGSRTFVRVEFGHPVDALAGSQISFAKGARELGARPVFRCEGALGPLAGAISASAFSPTSGSRQRYLRIS